MKKIRNFLLVVAITLTGVSCVGEFDNIEKFAGEVVYPASFDTIVAHIGFERVELDLWRAGRIRARDLKMGKSIKTVIEYDDTRIEIDTLCSWVNVTGLSLPKMYRIRVFTEDAYGNPSVPQTIAVIPFNREDVPRIEISHPAYTFSTTGFFADYSRSVNLLSTVHTGMVWQYDNAAGTTVRDSTDGNSFAASGFQAMSQANVTVIHKVVPILLDGRRLIDTVRVNRPLTNVQLAQSSAFVPVAQQILEANGITTFSSDITAGITEMTYPIHTNSFADLLHFPNLEKLDLTGQNLQMPILRHDNNGTVSTTGGVEWLPFMRRSQKENDIQIVGLPIFESLLSSGTLKEVRYIPGTMGRQLEAILNQYVASGQVVMVGDDDPMFEPVVFIPPQFFVHGGIVDNNWRTIVSYSGEFLPRSEHTDVTKFDPHDDIVDLQLSSLIQSDGSNIYRNVIRGHSAAFTFTLPAQYMYDTRRYPYLKFKMFCATPDYFNSIGTRTRVKHFTYPAIRMANSLWQRGGPGTDSPYGNQDAWTALRPEGGDNPALNNNVMGRWHEYTVRLDNVSTWWTIGEGINVTHNGNHDRRHRVIIVVFGGERVSGDGTLGFGNYPDNFYSATNQCVFYIADVRLSKTE